MLESYIDVIEASKILDVHPETVKRLIREGKLTATKFGNKWITTGGYISTRVLFWPAA